MSYTNFLDKFLEEMDTFQENYRKYENYLDWLHENHGKLPSSVFHCVNESEDKVMKRDFQLFCMIILEATQGCIAYHWWFHYHTEDPNFFESFMSASEISDLDEFLGRKDCIDNFTQVIDGMDSGYDIYEAVWDKMFDTKGVMPNNIYEFFRECKDKKVVQDFIRWLIPSLEAYHGCCENDYYHGTVYEFDVESKSELEMSFELDGSELSPLLLKRCD